MENKILETERLYLRELTPDDAPEMFALNLDPEVIRFTGDPPFANIEEARNFLKNYSDYARNGFGRWGVVRKVDEAMLGWCGLKRDRETGEVDLGYRFFKKFWGQGYATEAAKGCLRYGFTSLNLPVIIARVMHENRASIRVLEKTGLHFWKEGTCSSEPALIYKIEKEDFLKQEKI